MSTISRRRVLGGMILGVSSLPFSIGASRKVQAQQPLIRYDAHTPQGEAMIEKYARAVSKMAESPEGDPSSWLFQWYTHAVRSDRSMSQEIERVYRNAPDDDPKRLLAGDMWNTCQAHGRSGVPQDQR